MCVLAETYLNHATVRVQEHKIWEKGDAQMGETYCTVEKAETCSRKSCKRMCNCNQGGVEGCSKRAQKNTFFSENSRLGLQSYTDTSGEE